jgi:GGDEF domain-containing protein
MLISSVNPTSFANYTIQQLLDIPYEEYSSITAAQIFSLPKEKMNAIHINWLSDSALAGLTAENITGITDNRYFSEWIRPEQMALISNEAFAALEKAQLDAIKPQSFAALTVDQLLSISYEKYSAITAEQLSALPEEKMHAIHINWLSDAALASGLTALNITGIKDRRYFSEWIRPEQMALIKPRSFAALTVDQLLNISNDKYSAITAEQLSALPEGKMHAIHIDWLSDAALVSGLTARNITGIKDRRYFSEWIRPEQMALIKPSAFAALTKEQFSAINPASRAALTPEQWSAWLSKESPTLLLEGVNQNENLTLNLSIGITKTSIKGATSGGDSIGEKTELTLNFDQAVYGLESGTADGIFLVGGNRVNTTWSGLAGSTSRTLTYTVVAGQNGLATLDESALRAALLAGLKESSGKAYPYLGAINGTNLNNNTLPTVDTTKPKALTLVRAVDANPNSGEDVSQGKVTVGEIESNATWFYSVDSSDWKLGGQEKSIDLINGTHCYWLTQIDAAGNESVPEAYVAEWNAGANKLLQLLSLTDVWKSTPIINIIDMAGRMGRADIFSAPVRSH